MFYSNLSMNEDEVLRDCAEAGDTPEAIAVILRADGVNATVGQVRARLRFLRLPIHEESIDLEQEVWATLVANLTDLSEIEGRLRDLDEIAFEQDESLSRPVRMALTQGSLTKRAELILAKHKLLQLALTERVKRKLLEAGLPSRGGVHPPPNAVPPPAPTATSLPEPPPRALPAQTSGLESAEALVAPVRDEALVR